MNIGKNFNIYDLNFLLILVGFPLFTTFIDSSLGSIAYRAFALFISIICLCKTPIRFSNYSYLTKFVLFIFIIFIIKVTLEVTVLYPDNDLNNIRNNVLLFSYGIVGFPSLALLASYDKINTKTDLYLAFIIFLLILSIGINNVGLEASDERENLNSRQSTLAFGDNGAYLGILCLSILSRYKQLNISKITLLLFIFGLIVGAIAIAKAGSRGPLLGFIVASFFIMLQAPRNIKIIFWGGFIWFCSLGGSALVYLSKFSPVLYSRVMESIEHGDTSGRDQLFIEAFEKIEESPILGSNPVILESDTSFSSYHNCYLDIFVCLGVFWGIIYLFLVIYSGLKTLRKNESHSSAFQIFIFGLFWFYVIRCLSGVMIVSNSIYVSVMLLTTVFVSVHQSNILKK